jgi:FK506-binding nuclear protein
MILADQVPPDNVPFSDESDEDEEAFDLREVSSDVEMDPNGLELDSDDEG